jgi:hypothetical protein
MAEQYRHSEKELFEIAKLLRAMNRFENNLRRESIAIIHGPEIFWTDRRMGCIERIDQEDDDVGVWCYRPDSEIDNKPPASGRELE